jgi:hypothetical protein
MVSACFSGVGRKRGVVCVGFVWIEGQLFRQEDSGEKFLAEKAEGDRYGHPR